jgi:iron complex outermembrane receptor protein
MHNKIQELGGRRDLLIVSSMVALMIGGAAYAQEDDEADGVVVLGEEENVDVIEDDEDLGDDTVVVTGSRVRRDTFSSISPLQVITTEASRDIGLIDPSAILQRSEAASGQQIDATFSGFVTDNGPGSEQVNLRGLGAERTLLLVNGRRLAPAGVEGAPGTPSINFIPGTLVERYDLLLDGASSVYGSDAVAGVGNIILRKDFDGLELEASGDYNVYGAGHDYTLSAAWGRNTDRGFFGAGIEYDYRDPVRIADRPFNKCETNYEIDENGDIRTNGIGTQLLAEQIGQFYPAETCLSTSLGRRIRRVPGGLGFVYYTPGETNTGIPNFSEDVQFGVQIDGDGDGITDVVYEDYTGNGKENNLATFISEQKRLAGMAYGEYTFEGEMNVTPYFEAIYSDTQVNLNGGYSQLFTIVPANNPFNPCNPNQPNGVDCGLAADSLLTDPDYIESFRRYYFDNRTTCAAIGREACTPATFGLLNGPLGPQRAGGGVAVQGDRSITEVDIMQVRGVVGARADLPFLNFGPLNSWQGDLSLTYSFADGDSTRPGIRDDRLHYALGFDPNALIQNGQFIDLVAPCTPVRLGNPNDPSDDTPIEVSPDVADGCVPVNLFAPSLYESVIGEFATEAERDYLFDTRDFRTEYTQTILGGFVSGNVFQLPAGSVAAVAGFEYRTDEIDSIPDDVARDGLFFGFFSDQGAVGEKWTKEAFFELDVPLLGNKPLAEQLDLNASARWTEDEFYGSAWTYSIKGGWRPVDSLLLKASFGTSFRAPNLRENFLLGTTGFLNRLDPCVTPNEAIGIGGDYVPELDDRDPITLANCVAEGIDPTNFSPVGNNEQIYSVEIRSGGSLDLEEETSESFTAGFSFEQPWFESFDLSLNMNYYDIEIDDTVISPGSQFIINDCYTLQPDRQSSFCSRITRGGPDSLEPGRIQVVDAGFINQDQETVTGIDYNIELSKPVTMFNEPWDLSLELRANQLKERSTTFVDDNGNVNFDEFQGETYFPEWTGRGTFRAEVADYRFTYSVRYVGKTDQDPDFLDPFSDAFDSPGTGFIGDTCAGPSEGDVLCRDFADTEEVTYHSASIRYSGDTWTVVAGVENIFATEPPLVDGNELTQANNVLIGGGYEYDGREYFVTLRKDFQ